MMIMGVKRISNMCNTNSLLTYGKISDIIFETNSQIMKYTAECLQVLLLMI